MNERKRAPFIPIDWRKPNTKTWVTEGPEVTRG